MSSTSLFEVLLNYWYRSVDGSHEIVRRLEGPQTRHLHQLAECSAQVSGYSGTQHKAFDSPEAAEEAFRGTYEVYTGKDAPPARKSKRGHVPGPILDSYCVDASCIGNPGPVEYQCVHLKTRKSVFHKGPLQGGTSNIGEFLALVHGLVLLRKKGIKIPIYSDSVNAINWVILKKCKTSMERNEANEELFALIDRAEVWLCDNTYPNSVLKWNTDAWGENPADFGRK